jgi:hypothetical protein
MNQRVGRMLTKYASQTGQNARELKNWWEALPWRQRAAERKRILAALEAASKKVTR